MMLMPVDDRQVAWRVAAALRTVLHARAIPLIRVGSKRGGGGVAAPVTRVLGIIDLYAI